MKPGIGIVAFCLCMVLGISSFASSRSPVYFSKAKGILIGGGFDFAGQFELNAGKLVTCDGSESGDIGSYDCTVEGAVAVITQAGESQKVFNFDKHVKVFHLDQVGHGPGWYYEFEGTWDVPNQTLKTTSKVQLTLWRYDSTPLRVKGDLTLTDYPVSQGVEAAIE